ncbi:hypothetical protein GCM10027318_30140 [Massilia agilis]
MVDHDLRGRVVTARIVGLGAAAHFHLLHLRLRSLLFGPAFRLAFLRVRSEAGDNRRRNQGKPQRLGIYMHMSNEINDLGIAVLSTKYALAD